MHLKQVMKWARFNPKDDLTLKAHICDARARTHEPTLLAVNICISVINRFRSWKQMITPRKVSRTKSNPGQSRSLLFAGNNIQNIPELGSAGLWIKHPRNDQIIRFTWTVLFTLCFLVQIQIEINTKYFHLNNMHRACDPREHAL